MGKWRRAIGCALLCVLLLVPGVSVRADENVVLDAQTVEIQHAYTAEDVRVLDGFAEEGAAGWIAATGVSSVRMTSRDGVSILQTIPAHADSGEYTVMRHYPAGDEPNLMESAELTAQILVPGDAETMHTVLIRMYSGLNTWTAQAQIRAGAWHTVSAPIGEWKYRTCINMMEISVLSESEFHGFSLGSVYAHGEADLSVARQFMTFDYTADGGTASYRDGMYILDAGDDGTMTLVADAVRESYRAGEGICALRVVLDRALVGGYISLAVADGPSSVSSFTIASTCPIYYGKNTYLLPFDKDIPLRAYRLSFRGLYADGQEGICLREVSLEQFAEGTSSGVGKITECAFTAGMETLSMRGTLPGEVVTDYIDAAIGLFEIPVWMDEAEVLAKGEPIDTIRISTKFRFSVDLRGRKSYASSSRYLAAILTENGAIPIAAAQFPDYPTAGDTGDLSVVGLYGAKTADVFAANASAVIVDVDVMRLLGGEGTESGGQLYVRGGKHYYFDIAYIKQLDADIRFYTAADVEVYLRLFSSGDMSALSYTYTAEDAEFFAFDVDSEAGVQTLCAVTEYIAARYPSVRGFIAGERMDASVYNGADMTDMEAYAARCAVTMRLIYNSAVHAIPGVSVIAPMGHSSRDNGNPAGIYCDPVLFAAHLSRSIGEDGDMPWTMMYLSDSSAQTIGHMQNILSQIKTAGSTAPRSFMLMWEPVTDYAPDILLAEYNDRCQSAQRAGARVLFLSVAYQEDPAAVCAGLKEMMNGGNSTRQLTRHSAMLVDAPEGYRGKYVWGDFSHSYSTLGWMAGSGCDRLITQSGGFASGERSLHAVFGGTEGDVFSAVQGNILRANGVTEDMRYAPYVVYTLQVVTELESTSAAELTFVFGSGDTRAEYRTLVSTGMPVKVLCDLSEFSAASAVNFSAITLQCDSAASLDIQKIECFSAAYSDAELAEIYHYRETRYDPAEESGSDGMTRAQWAVCVLLGMGTVTAFALLSRREKEKE